MIIVHYTEDFETYDIPDTPIEELGFSTRLLNCLKQYTKIKGLHLILMHTKSDFRKYRQFGKKSEEELTKVLRILNLQLDEE